MTRLLLVAVFAGVGILAMSFFTPQLEKLRAMEADVAEHTALRDELQRQLDQRHNRQRLLRTDPEYLEQFARDKLDLQREGETIIRIDRTSGRARVSSFD